jgi:hypothetical protein
MDKYILSWGKPKLGTKISGSSESFLEWPDLVQGTAQLTTEAGNETEAPAEGGEVLATRRDKSKYTFECEVYAGAGVEKPIMDDDGIILSNYALRLIPENRSAPAWIMDNCSVSCVDTWSADIGHKWKYTFRGLKPALGKILKAFYVLIVSAEELTFTSAADTVGQAVTATATGALTAVSDAAWATVTVADNVATVTVTANTGTARIANITLSADGKTADVEVMQAGIS